MATKQYLVNLDVNLNEIQNVLIHKLGTDPAGVQGQIIYNTTDNCFKIFDGSVWQCVRFINDAGTGTTDLWSADQIQSAIDSALVGAVSYQGGYDAAANTPALEPPAAGTVFKGYMYTVTVAGDFYGQNLEIGDVLIAETDDPGALADWTIVEKNLDGALQSANNLSDVDSALTSFNNIKQAATETLSGVAEIATQAETDAGTDDTRIVTPLKLNTYISNQQLAKSFEITVNVGTTPGVVSIPHNLGTLKVQVAAYLSTGEEIALKVVRTSINEVTVEANGSTTAVNVVVIGG
jgi:hypothetical protein